MKIEKALVHEVHENPDNPRYIREDKFEALKKSIQEAPWMLELRPLVVDEKGIVLGGNMRLQACRAIGMKEVPIIRTKNLTEQQKKEMIIKDNVPFGDWDWDVLANEWDQQDLADWGLEVPEQEEPITLIEAEDDDFEIPDKVETDIVPGDLFEIGPHKLLCGSSTEIDTWARLMEERLADLVVTDPPYNVDYTGGTSEAMKIQNDNMDDASFYQFLYDFHTALYAYTKPGGAWYVWHADSEGLNFRRAFQDSGLDLKQTLIWVKNALVMGRQDYQWKHEPCLYGWKPGAAHYFIADRTKTTTIEEEAKAPDKMSKKDLVKLVQQLVAEGEKTTIIRHDKPKRNDLHPTMKPIPLIGELIQNSSRPGELVADGFLGSGTTMVAAHQLKRTCYGMDLDPKFCQVILERMIKLDPDLQITRNGKPYQI